MGLKLGFEYGFDENPIFGFGNIVVALRPVPPIRGAHAWRVLFVVSHRHPSRVHSWETILDKNPALEAAI